MDAEVWLCIPAVRKDPSYRRIDVVGRETRKVRVCSYIPHKYLLLTNSEHI